MKKILRPVDIARKLNISTSTLRNYESRGLIPPTQRLPTGYRLYSDQHVAYFECIVAMSIGFRMEIISDVLHHIQLQDIDSALWIINKAQVSNNEDQVILLEVSNLLNKLKADPSLGQQLMSIGRISREIVIPASTIRFWEMENLIKSIRNEDSNYRSFDMYQVLRMQLLKGLQNAIYSPEVVQIKVKIKESNARDLLSVQEILIDVQETLNKRNKNQLHGLYNLYRLCEAVNLTYQI